MMGGGIVKSLIVGTVIVGGFIGVGASISGDLRNADDIGAAAGDVVGAGVFGGIFGKDGGISHAMKQRDYFSGDNSKVPAGGAAGSKYAPQNSKNN